MPKMRGLLHSKPKIDEEELELARSRTEARLADLFGPGADAPGGAAPVDDAPEALTEAARGLASDAVEPAAEAPGPWPGGPRPSIVVEGETDVIIVRMDAGTGELVGVMARPGEDYGDDGWDLRDIPAVVAQLTIDQAPPAAADAVEANEAPDEPAETTAMAAVEVAATEPAAEPAEPTVEAVAATPLALPETAAEDEPGTAPSRVPSRRPARSAAAANPTARRTPAARTTKRKSKSSPAPVPTASCPYCALLLQPPPASSRRCARCRQRIVVKRVEGRAVLLTEAAVLVFEAERQRVATSGRLTRERERWLKLAASAGAPAERQARLAAAPLTAETVAATRALYFTTVDRAFKAARRDHEWEAAARIRRDQAIALYRATGSPHPPPDDLVALLREGAAAELRGISEISRDAELVSARCCAACTADDGRIYRIVAELRAPRLPHAECPKGLCRCRWDLAARDRSTIRRYLRRRPRTDSSGGLVDPTPTA